ncbi:hypothetical protein, partial [Neorhizobium sp. T6_25]|uniref:hypothetical protein n=1 Tax=Neorhizobium sp. T6_25 TaxID=2093833 RepID=UPI00197B48C0
RGAVMAELGLAKPQPERGSLNSPFRWRDRLHSTDAGVPSCFAGDEGDASGFRLNITIWRLWTGATSDAGVVETRWRSSTSADFDAAANRQRRRKAPVSESIFLLHYSSCLEPGIHYGNIHR